MEEYPTYQFSSTSSFTTAYTSGGIGGMTTTPTLGADGVAITPYSGAARAGSDTHSHYDRNRDGYCDFCSEIIGSNAGTPGEVVDPSNQVPMGDGVMLLLLLATAFLAAKIATKIKKVRKNLQIFIS